MNLRYFLETSLSDLYQSTVDAFPRTGLRQHATHPVVINQLRWTPWVGMKTLLIRGIADNESREYNTTILLKNIDYESNEITITANDGIEYGLAKPSLLETDVLLRCSCADFRWRFAWYDKINKSLFGPKPKKYESKGIGPPANPMEKEGMCKHIMKTIKVLQEAGLFSDSRSSI